MSSESDATPPTPIRIPKPMWAAYGRVCKRLATNRTQDVLAHIRRQIEAHGDEQDHTDLAAADQELAERRARMHPGRPRKRQD